MLAFAADLFPICRSITGPGLRATLDRIGARIPLTRRQVATGTRVLDWEIPREWAPRAARIERRNGDKVVDFADTNLHLVQYSHGLDEIVPMAELRRRIHTLPEHPEWVPYRTAYYADTWAFCLSQRQADGLTDNAYRVWIDADLFAGQLDYGECVLPGATDEEVLFSIHCCHPSLANDNLSGIVVACELAARIAAAPRRYTYRFLFIPGTIGSIAWLAANRDTVGRIRHGLVLTCLGDPAPLTYKQSRRGDAAVDRYAAHVLQHATPAGRITPFIPYGYDERQYCSPGFNLPVGALMRSPNATYPEYHSSADNLALLSAAALEDSLDRAMDLVEIVEADFRYRNLAPYGEPQLGRRGLYRAIGGEQHRHGRGVGGFDQLTLLWTLNLSDGTHSLFDIAERAGQPFAAVRAAAAAAEAAGLLERAPS